MKTSRILGLLVVMAFSASGVMGQVGKPFPAMEAETLSETMVNLPIDVQGKYTLIGLAYSKKSEDDLKTWFSPAYNQFMRPPSKTDIFANTYDVNLFFIPMFTGHKTVAYQNVMNKVRETIDKQLYPHVLFYKGTIKEYKEALNFQGKDIPYFFMLDENGTIVWETSGAYNATKMQEIVDMLDEKLGN